jgi:hypothetical protein
MFEKEKKENFNCIYDRAVKIATVEKKGTNKNENRKWRKFLTH